MINERVQGCIADTLTDNFSHLSKPSRQFADSCQVVNCLVVNILQQKTRQSDGFYVFLVEWDKEVHVFFNFIFNLTIWQK